MIPGTALVTGASRGIGAAIARSLAERGWRLILSARSVPALEKLRAGLVAPDRHRIVAADLTEDDEIDHLIAEVRREDLHLLILNAGTAVSASVEETTIEQWDYCMQLNLRAQFQLVRGLLEPLRITRGMIVAIGSIVSTASYPDQAAYAASKHGLYGFIKALAKELHPEIRVHSIQPGGVATDLVRDMRPDIDTSDLIQPEDVAAALISLLTFPGSAVIDEIRLRRQGKSPWQQG